MNRLNSAVLCLFAGAFLVAAQAPPNVLRWTEGAPCCTAHVQRDGSVRKVITSDGEHLSVGVTLVAESKMLDVWVAVASDRQAEVNPANFRIRIVTPVSKELSPIEEWKLNMLRIGVKERLRETTISPGGTASGYVLFPNEKKREHVLVEAAIGDVALEFPFDFANGSRFSK